MSGQVLNTTSYNALISAYTKAGSLPNVLETFQRMFDQARLCSSLPVYSGKAASPALLLSTPLHDCWEQGFCCHCVGCSARLCAVSPRPAIWPDA